MQDVGTDDEAFEDDDEAVETEDEAEAPLIVAAEGYGEDGADEGDHAAVGRDDLQQAAEPGPERGEGDVDEFEADKPEDSDDEGVEGGSAPPVHEGGASSLQVR